MAGLLLGGLLLAQTPARAEGVAEPEGYRGEPYRSPTPDTLRGARVLSTGDAEAIWKSRDAIFVDVLPRAPRPAGLPPGTIWREKPRRNIPGSIWLPDTGYDALAATTENYLRNNLARVTGGDKTRLLVDLLPARLLDVVECGEAHPRDGIPCRVVSGRHRRLGRRAAAAGGIQTRAAGRVESRGRVRDAAIVHGSSVRSRLCAAVLVLSIYDRYHTIVKS